MAEDLVVIRMVIERDDRSHTMNTREMMEQCEFRIGKFIEAGDKQCIDSWEVFSK